MSDDVQTIYQGKHIQLVKRERWEYVTRRGVTGIVAIVAVTDERKLLLVEQYRAPVNADVVELPAGLAGDEEGHEGEPLVVAAQRELMEETGYEAAAWEQIADGTPSAGISDEFITLFVAKGLKKTGAGAGVGGEKITLREVPLDRVEAWLDEQRRAGKLVDLKVYAGLHFARRP